ncbi:hypothetical protein AV656_00275 [Bhargavaea cecembensis]|uniref:Protein-glutamine gamma-glutamyltransferase-like C-terminal domain-containing protein n=1 Tax=Bhargavaea cecembensis TaxID=394098 RepID=A0A165HFH6_9BACL|nr:DUF4129 domain-containing protein [Bhargavaea cecembensis]KZE39768.1 hypothetical protein AV656_00275 [Bhargavaea cecembensis]
MKDRKMEVISLATLFLEVSVIYVLAAPPYLMDSSLPPVLPHLLAVMAGFAAVRLVSGNAGIAVSAVLALFLAWAAGLPPVHAAVLGAWIGWRMKREPAGTEWLAVLISIAYSLGVFMMILPGDAGQVIYVLIACQLAFAVLLRNARLLYRQPIRRREQDRALFRLSAGLFALTGLLVFAKPLVAWAGGMAGMSFGAVFYTFITRLTAPAWGPLEHFFGRMNSRSEGGDFAGEGGAGGEMPVMGAAEGIQWGPGALFAFLLVLGGAVLYSIFWNRNKMKSAQSFVRTAAGASDIPMEELKASGRNRTSDFRRNQIRREVYRLERRMRRAGFGQKPEETFRKWLGRLGLDPERRDRLNRLYARVRYGEEEIGTEEAESFRRSLRAIRPPEED